MAIPVDHGSPCALGFVDRGDPANPDYVLGALTVDGAWHALDLSAIVDSRAGAVLLSVTLKALGANRHMDFRTTGNANAVNVARTSTQVMDVFNSATAVVAVGPDGVVDYRAVGDFFKAIVMITVMGWWRVRC